jgi:hypothetical protein
MMILLTGLVISNDGTMPVLSAIANDHVEILATITCMVVYGYIVACEILAAGKKNQSK